MAPRPRATRTSSPSSRSAASSRSTARRSWGMTGSSVRATRESASRSASAAGLSGSNMHLIGSTTSHN